MKIIQNDTSYSIYTGKSVTTLDLLPNKTYTVEFAPMSGFYLLEAENLTINEKMYGCHAEKGTKVFNRFEYTNDRNLGAIFAGDKGLGKSLTARYICQLATGKYPVILINNYIKGLADFLSSLSQKCIVFIDEYDKIFRSKNNDSNPQDEMLSLFDGVDGGNKLYLITCNRLNDLNNYIINRPGRFHYCIEYEYPDESEIEKYLQDHISDAEIIKKELPDILKFSYKTSLNFDCLRAICEELNSGNISFHEAIKDLNIVKDRDDYYDVEIVMSDGQVHMIRKQMINMYLDYEERISIDCNGFYEGIDFYFNPSDSRFELGKLIIPGEFVNIKVDRNEIVEDKDAAEAKSKFVDVGVDHIEFHLKRNKTVQRFAV